MKAMAVVAHPDDCVIFAWSFIHHHADVDWTICYLTYHDHDDRAKEMARFWHDKKIPVVFLGYHDTHRDLETGQCSFDMHKAAGDIEKSVQDQSLILTHDHKGDYGHLHHKFVHDVVARYHDTVITFADRNSGNIEYAIENPDYSLLSIHRSVVESFHTSGHRNRYQISPSAQRLLGEFKQ